MLRQPRRTEGGAAESPPRPLPRLFGRAGHLLERILFSPSAAAVANCNLRRAGSCNFFCKWLWISTVFGERALQFCTRCRPGRWRAVPDRSSRPAVESLNKEIVIRVTRNSGVQVAYSRARGKGAAAVGINLCNLHFGFEHFCICIHLSVEKSFTLMCWHHGLVPNSAFLAKVPFWPLEERPSHPE